MPRFEMSTPNLKNHKLSHCDPYSSRALRRSLPNMRIGLLAASRIAVPAVIEPAQSLTDVEVAAVAARGQTRAKAYADDHNIPTAYEGYGALLEDETLDAIYVSTPASLHAEWAIRALEAGYHVLCEKPFAGNAEDAQRMARAGRSTGLVLMEAFHWRFHRYAEEMIKTVGRLERPLRVTAEFSGMVPKDNIRYQHDIGGGALMDLGCYPLHWIRTLLGEPTRISAEMDVTVPNVDDTTRASLEFSDGSKASFVSSMRSEELIWRLDAEGRNGTVSAINPLAPQEGNSLEWTIDGDHQTTEVGGASTYAAQLEAFRDVVAGTAEPLVTLEDSIANMMVIDSLYRSAGLEPRP